MCDAWPRTSGWLSYTDRWSYAVHQCWTCCVIMKRPVFCVPLSVVPGWAGLWSADGSDLIIPYTRTTSVGHRRCCTAAVSSNTHFTHLPSVVDSLLVDWKCTTSVTPTCCENYLTASWTEPNLCLCRLTIGTSFLHSGFRYPLTTLITNINCTHHGRTILQSCWHSVCFDIILVVSMKLIMLLRCCLLLKDDLMNIYCEDIVVCNLSSVS